VSIFRRTARTAGERSSKGGHRGVQEAKVRVEAGQRGEGGLYAVTALNGSSTRHACVLSICMWD
jgi:hypothetical protein